MRYARKAVVAGLTALLGTLGTAFSDGAVTPAEGVGIFVSTAIAVLAVYQVTNEEPSDGGEA